MLLSAQNRRQCCSAARVLALDSRYVLGPLMEEYLRRAKLFARGDATAFFTRPLSLAFMIGTVLILSVMIAPAMRKRGEGT